MTFDTHLAQYLETSDIFDFVTSVQQQYDIVKSLAIQYIFLKWHQANIIDKRNITKPSLNQKIQNFVTFGTHQAQDLETSDIFDFVPSVYQQDDRVNFLAIQ